MKPELLFLCAGVFACAAGLFSIANVASRNQDGYTLAVILTVVVALFFLGGGIDAVNKARKGGP